MTITRPGKAGRTWWRLRWHLRRVRWYVLSHVGRDSLTGLGKHGQGMRPLHVTANESSNANQFEQQHQTVTKMSVHA